MISANGGEGKKVQTAFLRPATPARNVLRERSSQLSDSRAPGPICALTTPGTCNYPRQFYDSADLGAARGKEETEEQDGSGGGRTHFRFNDFRRIKLYCRASPTHRDANFT